MSKKCLVCCRVRPLSYYTYEPNATACIKCWRRMPFQQRVQPIQTFADEKQETIDELPGRPGPSKKHKPNPPPKLDLSPPALKREITIPPQSPVKKAKISPKPKSTSHLESKVVDNFDHLRISKPKKTIKPKALQVVKPDAELLKTLKVIGMTYEQYLIAQSKAPASMKL